MKIIIAIALMAGVFSCFAQEEMVLWSFETKGKITSHPIIDGDQIFFGSQDSTFYSLDIISGDQIWSYKTKASIQSKALINNEIVYFKSGNDVYALNKNNGQEIWSSISKDETGAMQTDPWDYHSGAPAIYKSNIYFGLGNGKVKGLDLETGESAKEIIIPDSSAIKSGLVIESSVLYFGDWDGRIYAYNLSTGAQLWEQETYDKKLYDTFGQINSQLTVYGNLLFFGSRNPEMQVLDKNTGEIKWNFIENDGGWISGDPLVLNDTLFIGGSDNHKMLSFNANTGQIYWSFTFLNNNFSKPFVYKNYLLFSTGDAYSVYGDSQGKGYIYALNRSNGKIKNFAQIGGNIYTSLIVKDDILYMGSSDKSLYALDLNKFLNSETKLSDKGYNSVDILDVSPAPFTDTVKITYNVTYSTHVNIKIKDLNYDEIIELLSGKKSKGEHFLIWDSKDKKGDIVEEGHYVCEISSGEYFKKVFIQKTGYND